MAVRNKKGIETKGILEMNGSDLVTYIKKIEESKEDVIDFLDTIGYIRKNHCYYLFKKWDKEHNPAIITIVSDMDSVNSISLVVKDDYYEHPYNFITLTYNPNVHRIWITDEYIRERGFHPRDYYYELTESSDVEKIFDDNRLHDLVSKALKKLYDNLQPYLDDFFKWVGETFKEE